MKRAIQDLGYGLHRLRNKRALDPATKKKRVQWAREHAGRRPAWWTNRGFADAHYWYLPRTAAEAAATSSKSSVYRKRTEGANPKFHGRRVTEYKQGRRVGIWGVLGSEGLSVAFLPAGRITGESHAAIVRRYYASWVGGCPAVFHDGERALHGPAPKAAYRSVGVPCATLPPYSPDLNPIENVWALVDGRLAATAPKGFEREKAFRRRVRNAISWINRRRAEALRKAVASMPRRLELVAEGKGAMTPY